MDQSDLLAVGEVMLDVSASGLPDRGDRLTTAIQVRAGGSPVTAALAAAAAGGRATVIGRVGDDSAGHIVLDELHGAGVQGAISFDPQLATGTVISLELEPLTIAVDRGANQHLRPPDLPDPLIAKAVLVSGFAVLHEDTRAAARAAFDRAATPWLAVDAASSRLLERFGVDNFLAVTKKANVLFANEDEAHTLSSKSGPDAARELTEWFQVVCVKRGALGAVAATRETLVEAVHVPSTGPAMGAGDAFAGAFLNALAQGTTLSDALSVGQEAGAAYAKSGGRLFRHALLRGQGIHESE